MDDSATKFGYAFYRSYFFRNIVTLDQRFQKIKLKKIAKPYTVSNFCMGTGLAISVGSYPFSKIDTELYFDKKTSTFNRLDTVKIWIFLCFGNEERIPET